MSTILWLLLSAVGALSDLIPSPYAPRDLEVIDANSEQSSLSFLFRLHVDAPIVSSGLITVVFPPELPLKSTKVTCTMRYIRESSPTCTYTSSALKVTLTDAVSSNSTLLLKAEGFDGLKYTGGTQHFQVYTQNFTDGEARDINFSFGQLGFLPVPSVINPLTASLTVDSKLVNATTDYTLVFQAKDDIYTGSEFRLTLPSSAWPAATATTPCEVTARDYPVYGTFQCYRDRYSPFPSIRISGLSNDIPAGTFLTLKFKSMQNPVCRVAQQDLQLDVVAGGTYAIRQRLTLPLFRPDTGSLKDVTQKPYHSYAEFYQNNKVVDQLSFTTVTGIPKGGKVVVDFKYSTDKFTSGATAGCFLRSNSFFLNGVIPSCDFDAKKGKATITGMPLSAPGTTFNIVVHIALGTTAISAPEISTSDSSDCLIDQNNNKLGGIIISTAAKTPESEPDYNIVSGKAAWSETFKLSTPDDFKIGQAVVNMPSNWRPYPAERVFCLYTITTDGGVATTTNIPQELCTYSILDNTITWTPTTAITLTKAYTIKLEFGHRLLNSNEDYSWRPLVATSLSTYHEFVVRLYDSTLALKYAHHYLANVDPFNAKMSSFTAPAQFPAALYAPVTITAGLFFDSIPTDSNMETFIEVRFMLKTVSNSDSWIDKLGLDIGKIPCNVTLPLQSLSSSSQYYCELFEKTGTYVPVRIFNIGPLRRYLKPVIKILSQGPQAVAVDVAVHVGLGYRLNGWYYNYQQMDKMTANLGSAATDGIVNVRNRPTADTYCLQPTFLTLNLEGTITEKKWTMVVQFPGGWSFSDVGFRSKAGRCTALTVFNSPKAVVAECLTFTLEGTNTNFEMTGTNPAYTNTGTGKVRVILSDTTTTSLYYISADLTSCTAPSTVTTSASAMPQQRGAVGASVFLTFTLPGAYAAADSVLISLTNGKYTNSVCLPNSKVATCTQKDATFRVAVTQGTVKDVPGVEIQGALLPDDGNLSYTISLCQGSTDCANKSATGSGSVVLNTVVATGELLISKVELYPHNKQTDSHFHVQMVAALEIPKWSVITLKSSFTWPASDGFAYRFSHEYQSIVATTNSLAITVGKRIPAKVMVELECFYVNMAASADNKVEEVTGSVAYFERVFLTTPTVQVDAKTTTTPNAQKFIPFKAAGSNIAIDAISLDYINIGERATYDFTIKNLATTASTQVVQYLRIRFPSAYRLQRPISCQITTPPVSICEVMSDYRSVLIPFNQPLPTTNVEVVVSGVINPSGTTSGFTVATLFNQTLLDESKATTASLGLVAIPSVLDLMALNLTNTIVREPSTYAFLAKSYGAAWTDSYLNLTFSDEWRLQGLEVSCFGNNWTFPGRTAVVGVTDVTSCTNDFTNHISANLVLAQLAFNTSLLNITLSGIVNPNTPGFPSDISASLYSLAEKRVWAKSYAHLSQAAVTKVTDKGFRLYAPQETTIVVGTSQVITISTGGYNTPARYDLEMTWKSSNAMLKLNQENLTIAQGDYYTEALLEAPSTITPGTYYIYWTVSGDMAPLLYERLPVLRVTVVSALLPVQLQPLPALKSNSTSFPLFVRLPHSPASNLIVTITTETSATIDPSELSFESGVTEAFYTITTAAESSVWQSLSFALSGTDAATYWLPQSALGFSVVQRVETAPAIQAATVATPLQPHSVSLTVKTDSIVRVYSLLQEIGQSTPTADDLVANGTMTMVDPYQLAASLQFEGLKPAYKYDWFGVVEAETGLRSAVKRVVVRTSSQSPPAEFVVEVQGAAPVGKAVVESFHRWTASVLSVPLCNLDVIQVAVDEPEEGTHQLTFRLYAHDSDIHQSPLETLQSLPSIPYLAGALSDYTITRFADSISMVATELPYWNMYPRLFNGNNDMVQIVCEPGVDGFVYVSAYAKPAAFPDSRDVKWARTPLREAAIYSAWQVATAGKESVLSLTGLAPSGDYVVYVVLQNSRTDVEELSDPVPLSVPQTVFSYLNSESEIDSATVAFVAAGAFYLF